MGTFIKLNFIFSLVTIVEFVSSANWAQHAGKRAQNIVTPYIPQTLYKDASYAARPMWTARWGHAVVVLNQTSMYRNDLSIEENSQRANNLVPEVVLLGGDDYSDDESASSGGFRNDIWFSKLSSKSEPSWTMNKRNNVYVGSNRIHTPPVHASMTWYESNPGYISPLTWPSGPKSGQPLTYDDWISCQDYFKSSRPLSISCDNIDPICNEDPAALGCQSSTFKNKNMWSPRRGHAAVVANNNTIYVIGGRAREQVHDHDLRIVGGPNYMPVKDHSTYREQAVLKNDIWKSNDSGKTWELVTPGCRDQQEDVLLGTEFWSKSTYGDSIESSISGSTGAKCKQSSDCYGNAECKVLEGSTTAVCVCSMFGIREHHSVTVQHRYFKRDDNTTFSEDYLYLAGGFTTVRQNFCRNSSCGSYTSYRLAMNDAWVSNDGGVSWLQLKPALGREGFRARGGHTSLLLHSNPFLQMKSNDQLILFGGETSDVNIRKTKYLNDIWAVNLTTTPCCVLHETCDVYPHTLSQRDIELSCLPSVSDWNQVSPNASWSGRSGHTSIHEPPSASNRFTDRIFLMGGKDADSVLSDVWVWDLSHGIDMWKRDFDIVTGTSNQTNAFESMNTNYRAQYHDQNSGLSELNRLFLPLPSKIEEDVENFYSVESMLSSEEITKLSDVGIETFWDLSTANLRTILKLRGFDYPGREKHVVPHICYLKALVTSVLEKCSVQEVHYENNRRNPYDMMSICEPRDEKCIVQNWDGCAPIKDYTTIDVHGIGDVIVPTILHDPSPDVEEIHCKQTPGFRYLSAGAFVDGRVLLLGGKGSNLKSLYQDVWSRDDTSPQANMRIKPTSRSTQSRFIFDSNEDGAMQFEYKLFDNIERLDVTPWLQALANESIDVSWLDTKKGGPGSGWYTLYLRAIDTGGNRDVSFTLSKNVYTWYYLQPLPWSKISVGIVASVIFLSVAYIQYRHRERKAALKRFEQRRMKRKFKLHAMSDGGKNDWKEHYHANAVRNKSRKAKVILDEDKSTDGSRSRSRSSRHSKTRRSAKNEDEWKKRRRERRERRGEAINNRRDGGSSEEEIEESVGNTRMSPHKNMKRGRKPKIK